MAINSLAKITPREVSRAHWPIFFSAQQGEKATPILIRQKCAKVNPGSIQKMSYMTLGGIISTTIAIVVGFFGLIFKNSLTKLIGGVIGLLGVEALINGYANQVDLSKVEALKTKDSKIDYDEASVDRFFEELRSLGVRRSLKTRESIRKLLKKYGEHESGIIRQGTGILIDEDTNRIYRKNVKATLDTIARRKDITELLTYLEGEDAYERIWAAMQLGRKGDRNKNINKTLIATAEDGDADVRAAVAIALATRGHADASGYLVECLRHDEAKGYLFKEVLETLCYKKLVGQEAKGVLEELLDRDELPASLRNLVKRTFPDLRIRSVRDEEETEESSDEGRITERSRETEGDGKERRTAPTVNEVDAIIKKAIEGKDSKAIEQIGILKIDLKKEGILDEFLGLLDPSNSDLNVVRSALGTLSNLQIQGAIGPLSTYLKIYIQEYKKSDSAEKTAARHYIRGAVASLASTLKNHKHKKDNEVPTEKIYSQIVDVLDIPLDKDINDVVEIALGEIETKVIGANAIIKRITDKTIENCSVDFLHNACIVMGTLLENEKDLPKAISLLTSLLKHKSDVVKGSSACTLGKIGNKDSGEKVLATLRQGGKGPEFFIGCAEAAGNLFEGTKNLQAVDLLIPLLKYKGSVEPNQPYDVHLASAHALGQIGGEAALKALKEALGKAPKKLKARATEALEAKLTAYKAELSDAIEQIQNKSSKALPSKDSTTVPSTNFKNLKFVADLQQLAESGVKNKAEKRTALLTTTYKNETYQIKDDLIEIAKDGKQEQGLRIEAINCLGEIGYRKVQAVLTEINERDDDEKHEPVKTAAGEALASIDMRIETSGSDQKIQFLNKLKELARTHSPVDAVTRISIMRELKKNREELRPLLFEIITHSFKELDYADTDDSIMDLLYDSLQQQAVYCLGKILDPNSRRFLETYKQDYQLGAYVREVLDPPTTNKPASKPPASVSKPPAQVITTAAAKPGEPKSYTAEELDEELDEIVRIYHEAPWKPKRPGKPGGESSATAIIRAITTYTQSVGITNRDGLYKKHGSRGELLTKIANKLTIDLFF